MTPRQKTTVKELQEFLAWHLENGGKETDAVMICDDAMRPTWFDAIPLGTKFERLQPGTTDTYIAEDVVMLIPTADPNRETLDASLQRAA